MWNHSLAILSLESYEQNWWLSRRLTFFPLIRLFSVRCVRDYLWKCVLNELIRCNYTAHLFPELSDDSRTDIRETNMMENIWFCFHNWRGSWPERDNKSHFQSYYIDRTERCLMLRHLRTAVYIPKPKCSLAVISSPTSGDHAMNVNYPSLWLLCVWDNAYLFTFSPFQKCHTINVVKTLDMIPLISTDQHRFIKQH